MKNLLSPLMRVLLVIFLLAACFAVGYFGYGSYRKQQNAIIQSHPAPTLPPNSL